MDFKFTEEQDQFREVVARFMSDKSPPTAVRRLMATDDGVDQEIWRQACGELGLAGIHLPEAHGGAGFGAVELGIAMEEQGRSLFCGPFLSSAVMAAYAVDIAGNSDAKSRLLPQIASGERIATLAISEADALWTEDDCQLSAEKSSDGYRLTGTKRFVVDGLIAQDIIVIGRTPQGLSLFCVDADSPGLSREAQTPMDPTRKIAEMSFKDTPATLISGDGSVALDPIFDAVLIAFANEMIGGAQALLQSIVDYTGLRVQFGRTIGSFQAIKHRSADAYVMVELAKSAAYQAAQLLASGESATVAASIAKASASEAYLHVAKECVQFHGGIGFTWENDTHLWFKRAKSSEVFLGTPAQHRERMLQAMGV